jgi:hypothetical protein
MKTSLIGQTFDEPEQLLEAITKFLNEIHPPEVVAVFSHWVERMRCVLENNGDYYHEEIHILGKHFLIRLPEPWSHYFSTPWTLCRQWKSVHQSPNNTNTEVTEIWPRHEWAFDWLFASRNKRQISENITPEIDSTELAIPCALSPRRSGIPPACSYTNGGSTYTAP